MPATTSAERSLPSPQITLFPHSLTAVRGGKKIPLRRKEFDLLEFLLRNRRRAIGRLTLLEYVWGCSAMAVTNTLEVHVSSLRRKLDHGFGKKILRTINGGFYILN
jgi:DNA-binding response OmpR family regulator